jgi:hypothetical protein
MDIIYSKKALLYLEGNLRTLCETAFLREGFDAKEGVADSIEAISKAGEEGVLTSYIRSQLISLIERKGMPSCFVLAYPARLGISKEKDPNGSLLIKALLLSCLLVSFDPRYDDVRFHFLIATKGEERIKSLSEEPEQLLSLIHIEKPELKKKLDVLRKDKALFARQFFFKAVDADRIYADPHLIVKGFLMQIDARLKLEKKVPAKPAQVIATKNEEPAHVIFITDKAVWVDGVSVNSYSPAEGLAKGRFHIVGSLSTNNLKDAIALLKKGIREGVCGITFPPDEEITLTVGDRCTIDATAATAFAQLMITDLARYKKKKIVVNSVNEGMIRRSHGYMMIREYIRLEQY